jgi:hypothetical protein
VTSNYSPKKAAKLDERTKEAQAKAAQSAQRSYKPAPAAPAKPAPGTSYRPSQPTSKPTSTSKSTSSVSYRPGDLDKIGYKPTKSEFKVGYRPTTAAKPQGYKPPTMSEGRWHYNPPPFEKQGYRPRARFHRPCNYGHWAYDYYPGYSWRSAFFYFDVYPYVEVTNIYECDEEPIEFIYEPIYVTGAYYVDNPRWEGVDEALADIRSSWLSGRFDLLGRHVEPESRIAVLIDGEYDYAVDSVDYLAMTEDAIVDLETISFIWNKVRERKDGTIMAFADHSYWSGDRARTVYVSYTLKRIGLDYYITEVGSSLNPLSQQFP